MTHGKYKIRCKFSDNPRLYKVWSHMIDRCCSEKSNRKEAYKNTSVCERWFCLDYFFEDAVKIEGWNEEEFNKGNLQLDKDFKQQGKDYKVYSKDTCIWVDKLINNKYQPNNGKYFVAISPNGDKFTYFSQHECARQNNLRTTNINQCLNKKRKTHKGWSFHFID